MKCDRLFPGAMSVECPLLCFVMPCYNEEPGICGTIATVKEKLESLEKAGKVSQHSAMLFADEASGCSHHPESLGLHVDAPAGV